MMFLFELFATTLLFAVPNVEAHGYMISPVARNAMWKLGYNNPTNYDLMSLNAGGPSNVMRNGYSVCGDPANSNEDHMDGGKYGNKLIAGTYEEGGEMGVSLVITAHHKGSYFISLCPITSPDQIVTQECFDQYQLEKVDGGIEWQSPPVQYNTGNRNYSMKFRLPKGLTCERCVVQWYWQTTNSIGDYPEEFWNCADITIKSSSQRMTGPPSVDNGRGRVLWNPQANNIQLPSTTKKSTLNKNC
eukprot:Awhi_evm1s4765